MVQKASSDAFAGEAGQGLCYSAPPVGAESRTHDNSFGIIPLPLSIKVKEEKPFKITDQTAIVYRDEDSKECAEYLQERITRATGMQLKAGTAIGSNAIFLKVSPDEVEFTEKDAYYFESGGDKITITGKSASGLFHGVQTLLQLLPAAIYSDTTMDDLGLVVDALWIKDRPVMEKIRGLHVDIARHFRTKDELLKIIDCMVMHKLNSLHLHLTDCEGWGVELTCCPKLSQASLLADGKPKYWTQQEIGEIREYARRRYVSIIPEIDMPGHMGAAIRALPELKSPTEDRTPGWVIRNDAEGINFAKKALSEVDSLFDPDYIHLGFDEVNYGLEKPVYTDRELVEFAGVMCTFVKQDLKKTPIVWDDVFVKGYHDKDTVVQWWRYGKVHWWSDLKYSVDEELVMRKQPFIASPAYWTYFDMPNEGPGGWAEAISTAEVYNWDPFVDMTGCTEDTRNLARGSIACTWSEQIVTMKDFGERTFPRLASFAERTWRGGKSDHASVLRWEDYRDKVLIPYQLARYDALKVFYWSKDNPHLLTTLKDVRKRL